MFFCVLILVCLIGVFYAAPLLRPRKMMMPILFMSKIGTPPNGSKDKKLWLSVHKLNKLLATLKKKGYTPVLPREIVSGTLPKNPVCLLFGGGYETFYSLVFPLLEKYNFKAAAALSASLIGQYDAWQSPQTGPWQKLLTAKQIQQLQASGRVEFISASVDGLPVDPEDDDKAIWQMRENKTRLLNLHKLDVCAVYFPQRNPRRPAVCQQARALFALLIGNDKGNNMQPVNFSEPLRVFRVKNTSSILRLIWRLSRS